MWSHEMKVPLPSTDRPLLLPRAKRDGLVATKGNAASSIPETAVMLGHYTLARHCRLDFAQTHLCRHLTGSGLFSVGQHNLLNQWKKGSKTYETGDMGE